jgi:xylulokinase
MSLLGIDVGTTGCKAVIFSTEGKVLALSYREYDFMHPRPDYAELDAREVWGKIKEVVREAAAESKSDPVQALAVCSMGEAMVPVTAGRTILGPSIMNFDSRGGDYLDKLPDFQNELYLYGINGNTLGNHYGLTKLLWIRDNQPEIYEKTDKFLNWGSFVSFMLGSEPVIDYSLANRSLLFDLNRGDWSEELLSKAGLDREKLPTPKPSGVRIGALLPELAEELGLPEDLPIVTGAHDQCSNALGAGVIEEGQAMYGMGSFHCVVPAFQNRRDPKVMIRHGFNTEHHAVPDHFALFIYQPGGMIVKWFRDTYALEEHKRAQTEGRDIYTKLFSELPEEPTKIFTLPHFSTMGPPDFTDDACGLITGLHLNTTRGEILKGIVESVAYTIRQGVEGLPDIGLDVTSFRAVGGGSKSDRWVQILSDVIGKPFIRPRITEAGALGAAILAGSGIGVFDSEAGGTRAMLSIDREFEPDLEKHRVYNDLYERYGKLWPLIGDYLRHEVHG